MFVCRFLKRDRKIAEVQMKMASRLDESFKLPKNLLNENFAHIGECFAEALALERIILNKRPNELQSEPVELEGIRTHGYKKVVEKIIEKKGAIFLSAHVGPIELLAAYFVSCGADLYVIGRLPNNPGARTVLKNLREKYGTKVIWRGEKDSPRKLLKAIKSGGVIAALIDQDTSLESEFAPAMGVEAAFPIAPINLALKYSIPIFACFIVRTRKRNYSVIGHEIKYDKDSPTASQDILREYSTRLDNLIKTYPEQWVWWHRRWRRRPGIDYNKNPESLISTNDYIDWIQNTK